MEPRVCSGGAMLSSRLPVTLLSLLAILPLTRRVAADELNPVKVGVLEALASLDSSSSERYKQFFESAIYYSLGENERALSKCGYKFEIVASYFDNSDKLAAKEAAQKLENAGAWIILGPRRSDQFLVGSKSLVTTPIVSPMAGANSVTSLPAPNFTMYPSVDALAKVAVKAVKRAGFGNRYGSFVDATCSSCKDFQAAFAEQSSGKLTEVFSIDGAGESPDLTQLRAALISKRVDFLILPNYSKFSGYTISKLQAQFPNLKVLGADGWGDGQFGFLEGFGIAPSIVGISVRGGGSPDVMSTLFGVRSLDREWQGKSLTPPYAAFGAIEFFRVLTKDLCRAKPKSRENFYRFLKNQNSSHFKSRSGIGVYFLRNSQLKFSHSESL